MKAKKTALPEKRREVSPEEPTNEPRREAIQPGGIIPQQDQPTGSLMQAGPQSSETQGTDQAKVASKAPKKRFSKLAVLIIGLVVLLGVFVFLLIRLRSGGPSLGSSGEIIWWGLLDESAVATLIAEYQAANKKIKITYIKQSTIDYRERLTSSLAKGEGPDIFRIHNSWAPMFKNDLGVLPSDVIDAAEFSQYFYPVIVKDLTTQQGIVGIPLGYDAITLYINQDIFAAAGQTPPATWDEFRRLAVELTTKSDSGLIIQSGTAIGRTENVDHWQDIIALMMVQNGADLSNPEGKLAEDAVSFFTSFAPGDEVWSEILPPSTNAFANGKVAMYFGPSRRASEISRINPNLRYKTIPIPQLRKDDPGEPDVTYATYWVESVWKDSSNHQEAWEFLKFLSEKESLEQLYENLSKTQTVGEPYPRPDMRSLLAEDKITGSIAAMAPQANSWYLVDETFDGTTGINSQISAIFKEAIDNVVRRGNVARELKKAAPEVAKVLSKFGIRSR